MVKELNNNKKLIISHVADVDGISALILAKLHYKNIDYCLVEFSELEEFLRQIVSDQSYKQYDEIFVTDVSFRNNTLEFVDSNEELKNKIKHFDHHLSELDLMNKYSFVNEVDKINGKKVCGTTLFYNHIKDDFNYKSEYLDKYLEAVCDYDTGGPLCGNQYGVDLTTLITLIGRDNFINKISNGIINKKDPITKEDMNLINQEYKNKKDYIDLCDNNLVRINLNGYNAGVSISELYRSDVGNALSNKYKDELDFILIINFMRNQFSFRTVQNNIDVGKIAKSFTKDGGGNPKAAGMPINKDTMFILDLVKDELLKKDEMILTKK